MIPVMNITSYNNQPLFPAGVTTFQGTMFILNQTNYMIVYTLYSGDLAFKGTINFTPLFTGTVLALGNNPNSVSNTLFIVTTDYIYEWAWVAQV